jgi:hypothetical protein
MNFSLLSIIAAAIGLLIVGAIVIGAITEVLHAGRDQSPRDGE